MHRTSSSLRVKRTVHSRSVHATWNGRMLRKYITKSLDKNVRFLFTWIKKKINQLNFELRLAVIESISCATARVAL